MPGAKRMLLPSGTAMRRLPFGIARGLRMEIDFRIQTKTYLGLYEIELNRCIREMCSTGARCFDVGGQFGYDALVFAKLTDGLVRSFDWDADAVATMRRTFAANPQMCDRIDVLHAIIADQSDTSSRRLSLDDAAWGPGGFVPDVVKIDIDGGEVAALEGGKRLMAERQPHMIVETHSPELEQSCAELLIGAGYRPTVIDSRRWLRDLRPIPHNRWLVARGAHRHP